MGNHAAKDGHGTTGKVTVLALQLQCHASSDFTNDSLSSEIHGLPVNSEEGTDAALLPVLYL